MKTFNELIESAEGMKFHDAIDHAKKHGHRVVYGTMSLKWHSIDKHDRDYHTALEPDEAKRHGMASSMLISTQRRTMKESEFTLHGVATKREGPTPIDGPPKKVVDKQEHTFKVKGTTRKHALSKGVSHLKGLHPDYHSHEVSILDEETEQFKVDTTNPSELRPHFGLHEQTGINRTVVQEAFEAAKKKKKDTKTPKSGTKAIEVKGPGPDEKFQKNPIVTPLTTIYSKS